MAFRRFAGCVHTLVSDARGVGSRAALQVKRALYLIIGTLGGLVIAFGILLLPLKALGQIITVGVLQLLTELYVGRNYAVALLFVTPMALLMVEMAHPEPIAPIIFHRGAQTIIGSVVGLAIVFGSHAWRPDPRSTR